MLVLMGIVGILFIVLQLSAFTAVLWGIYELAVHCYWKFLCYGIENKLIEEDIFSRIEEIQKVMVLSKF